MNTLNSEHIGVSFTVKGVTGKTGNITAMSYAESAKKVCGNTMNSAGTSFALLLKAVKRVTKLLADSADLAFPVKEEIDAKGNKCLTACNVINYSLSGSMECRGGMAGGANNYILNKTYPVKGGVNRFLIRSTRQPGTIMVKGTSEGLKDATITITAKPFTVENGLSKALSLAGLPSNRNKIQAPSYTIIRTPINIVSAIAGANAVTAFATQNSHASHTFHCTRKREKKIQIQLTGVVAKRSAGMGVEVSGKKLDDGVARDDSKAKGTLSIIEAEIYESLSAGTKK